jgi:hypothetical protein
MTGPPAGIRESNDPGRKAEADLLHSLCSEVGSCPDPSAPSGGRPKGARRARSLLSIEYRRWMFAQCSSNLADLCERSFSVTDLEERLEYLESPHGCLPSFFGHRHQVRCPGVAIARSQIRYCLVDWDSLTISRVNALAIATIDFSAWLSSPTSLLRGSGAPSLCSAAPAMTLTARQSISRPRMG